MKRYLLAIAFLCLSAPALGATQIYSWTDAQGNTVYSDQKPPSGVSSHSVKLKPLTTVPAKSFGQAPGSTPATSAEQPGHAAPMQRELRIVSPHNEQAIRANNGDISVTVQIQPPLASGQSLRLYLDGKPRYVGRETSIPLSNIDRGEHQVYVILIDAGGQVLRRSKAVTFYVLRHSILFKKPTGAVAP